MAAGTPTPQGKPAKQGNQLPPVQLFAACGAVGGPKDDTFPHRNAQDADIEKAAHGNAEEEYDYVVEHRRRYPPLS